MLVQIPPKVCHCTDWQWVDCSFCGSGDYAVYYYVQYSWVNLCVVRCRRCEHVFTNPVPTPQAIRAYYDAEYISSPNRDVPPSIEESLLSNGKWAWRHDEFRYKLRLLRRMTPLAGPFLEVGQGWGGLLYQARSMGVTELHALDVSSGFLAYAAQETGCVPHQGFLAEAELPAGYFSIVVANNYLEHSLTPREDLVRCHQLLNKGGHLLLALPNLDGFLANQQQAYWRAIRGGNHYHHFRPAFLSAKLQEIGFTIRHVSTTSRFYHWPDELSFELSARAEGRPVPHALRALERKMQGEETIIVAAKD